MKKFLKVSSLLLAVLGVCEVSSETVVYQNGLSGYDGCSDSYIYSVGASPGTQGVNFGTSELLKTAN